jgi:putative SOS response-associated peptidase YedK
MCGRFVLISDLSAVAQSFGVTDVSLHFLPDRNIHPGRHIPAVIRTGQGNMPASFLMNILKPYPAEEMICEPADI